MDPCSGAALQSFCCLRKPVQQVSCASSPSLPAQPTQFGQFSCQLSQLSHPAKPSKPTFKSVGAGSKLGSTNRHYWSR